MKLKSEEKKPLLKSKEFLKKVEYVKTVYYNKFGLRTILIDQNANIINKASQLWYCKNYYCSHREKCRQEHYIVLKESLNWGGNFFYSCHRGFVLWSIPILFEGEFYGGMLSGFVLFNQEKDRLKEKELQSFFNGNEKLKFIEPSCLNYIINFLSLLIGRNEVSYINYLITLQKKYYLQEEILKKLQINRSIKIYAKIYYQIRLISFFLQLKLLMPKKLKQI